MLLAVIDSCVLYKSYYKLWIQNKLYQNIGYLCLVARKLICAIARKTSKTREL